MWGLLAGIILSLVYKRKGTRMTYSLVGRCARIGMFGAAATKSSGAVGSCCTNAQAKLGAVFTQHRTDPRLGPRGHNRLEAGHSADTVNVTLTQNDPTIGWRNLR